MRFNMADQQRVHIAFQFLKQAQSDIFSKSFEYQIEQLKHYFDLDVSEDDLKIYFQPTLDESIEDLQHSVGDYYE